MDLDIAASRSLVPQGFRTKQFSSRRSGWDLVSSLMVRTLSDPSCYPRGQVRAKAGNSGWAVSDV